MRGVLSRARRAAVFWMARPAIEVLRRLPPGPAAAAGALLGRVSAAVLRGSGRRAARNVALAFPERTAGERSALVREHFVHMGRGLGEYLSLTRRDPRALLSLVRVEGAEHLERARDTGRGAVLLTAHLGHWEIMGAVLAGRFPGFAAVGRALSNPGFSRLTEAWRARFGLRIIHTDDARGILRHLRGGGLLGVVADQDSGRVANLFIPFFGRPAATPAGPVRLAQRTGAVLLTGFITREDGGYRLVVALLSADPAGESESALLERFNARLEEEIRRRPEQWVWLHDRWRSEAPPAAGAGTRTVAGALAAVALLAGGCREGAVSARPGSSALRTGAGAQMRGMRLREVVKGRVAVEFEAEQAWQARGAGEITARGVRAIYHPETGRPARLTTRTARFDVAAQRLVSDGVVRVEAEGGVLDAVGLTWDGRAGRLTSPGRVRIVRGDNVLTGRGLEADPGLAQVDIKEDVRILALDPSDLQPLVDGPGTK